jgi:hypothetical protein
MAGTELEQLIESMRMRKISEDEVIEAVQALQEEVDLNASHSTYGATLATAAAELGYEDVISLLKEKDVDLGRQDDHGYTPAAVAAVFDKPFVIKALAEANVDLNATSTEEEKTPAQLAVEFGHKEVIKSLIVNGVTVGPDTRMLLPHEAGVELVAADDVVRLQKELKEGKSVNEAIPEYLITETFRPAGYSADDSARRALGKYITKEHKIKSSLDTQELPDGVRQVISRFSPQGPDIMPDLERATESLYDLSKTKEEFSTSVLSLLDVASTRRESLSPLSKEDRKKVKKITEKAFESGQKPSTFVGKLLSARGKSPELAPGIKHDIDQINSGWVRKAVAGVVVCVQRLVNAITRAVTRAPKKGGAEKSM